MSSLTHNWDGSPKIPYNTLTDMCCCSPEFSFGKDFYKNLGIQSPSETVRDMLTSNATYVSNDFSYENIESKGTNIMDMFNGIFGKVQNGMCRLSMNGGIAVKTSNGYKTYDIKTERLTNCSDFVFNIGEEFFFVIPTNKVSVGDIVLISGKPKCVIEINKKTITVINYEDSTIETILPDRHIFLGNTYLYGKIVTMFGNDVIKDTSHKKTKKLMTYMMMNEMIKGNSNPGNSNGFQSMMPIMLMNAFGLSDCFKDMFNFCEDDEDDDIEDTDK